MRLSCFALIGLLARASTGWAATYNITNDTYIDSYDATMYNPALYNQNVNYGNLAVIKATTSPGSGLYPLANSKTRALFTLPQSFWDALGSQNVSSAIIEIGVKTNSLAGRQLEMHPLTQSFVAGTGGTTGQTQGGVVSNDANPNGATWLSSTGKTADAWNGGAFDSAYVNAKAVTSGLTTFKWDIAGLLDNPTTRAEIQQHGLLIKTYSDSDYPNPQQFASLWSSDSAGVTGSILPTATFVVPEPASLGVIGGLTLLALRRKRQA